MKKKDFGELARKEEPELESLVSQKRQEKEIVRLELSSAKVKNIRAGKILRRDIAQILTVLSQRRLIKEAKEK